MINFQKPTIQLNCPDEIRESLTQSLSQFFAVQTEEGAKLGLESKIDVFTETSSQGTHKVIIEGGFIMTAMGEYVDVLWKSSNTIDGTAISSSKERAIQSAKNAFMEDFNYFVLPQLQRSLDY